MICKNSNSVILNTLIDIDDNKYPGYKESLENLKLAHPNWNFKFCIQD